MTTDVKNLKSSSEKNSGFSTRITYKEEEEDISTTAEKARRDEVYLGDVLVDLELPCVVMTCVHMLAIGIVEDSNTRIVPRKKYYIRLCYKVEREREGRFVRCAFLDRKFCKSIVLREAGVGVSDTVLENSTLESQSTKVRTPPLRRVNK